MIVNVDRTDTDNTNGDEHVPVDDRADTETMDTKQ